MQDKRQYKKKTRVGPTRPPQRTATHRTDSAAVRFVEGWLPLDWLRRDTQERDYGIDMLVEIFEGDNPTGGMVLLQVKGHADSFSDPVVMQIPVKTLLYAQSFATPFFLLNISIADNRGHYVWLQKYIKTRLQIDSQNWRNQDKVNIIFPLENRLNEDGIERIAILAKQYAQRDVGLQCMHHSSWVLRNVDEYRGGNRDAIDSAVEHAEEMNKFSSFWDFYSEFAEDLDVDDLLSLLKKAQCYREFGLDEEDEQELDKLVEGLTQVQLLFLSNDDIERFAVENSEDHVPY